MPRGRPRERPTCPGGRTACNPADAGDVAGVGVGIVGPCVADFAAQTNPALHVRVIEPDPTDAFASDLRSSGGCRVQFTVPEHIDRSLFGIDFVRDSGTKMSTPGRAAQADWIESGDLLLVPSGSMANRERNARVQQSRDATADALAPHESADRFVPVEVRSESVRSRPIR